MNENEWQGLTRMVGQDPAHQIRRPNSVSRFEHGAAWQRAALLSDHAVESAARRRYETAWGDTAGITPWDELPDNTRKQIREGVRATLAAALGPKEDQ